MQSVRRSVEPRPLFGVAVTGQSVRDHERRMQTAHGKCYGRQNTRQFLPVVRIGVLGALGTNAADIRERAQRLNHRDLESPQKQDCKRVRCELGAA